MTKHYTESDVKTLREACEAIQHLKAARDIALKAMPRFTALDSYIEEIEEWASLWAAESGTSYDGDVTEQECVRILDMFKIEHRPYA